MCCGSCSGTVRMVNNNRLRSASLVTGGTSITNLCTGGKRPILKPAVALMTMRGALFAARIIGRGTPPKCKVINAVASKTRGSELAMRTVAVIVRGVRMFQATNCPAGLSHTYSAGFP